VGVRVELGGVTWIPEFLAQEAARGPEEWEMNALSESGQGLGRGL